MRSLCLGALVVSLCVTQGVDAAYGKSYPKSKKMVAAAPVDQKAATKEYQAKNFSRLLGMDGFNNDLLTTHFKLYEGYVKNTNALNSKIRELAGSGQDRSPEYAGLKRMYGWEFDGMRLHEYYFGNLGGNGALGTDTSLYKAITDEFGTYEKWRQDFEATGMIRGIGWVILYRDPHTGRLSNVWISEHNLNHLAGATPLLAMDVWEHAYMPQYGLDRAGYIQAFFKNIDWKEVSNRFEADK